jgi:hypothetical protein
MQLRKVKLNMANNVVAYVGIENFDYILYTARILTKAGKKVLLIDHSESMLLKYSFPQPEGIHCDDNLITYRGVDFTTISANLDLINLYDDILIFYGFNASCFDMVYCNRIICVTDLFRYHHEKIVASLSESFFLKHGRLELLVRDYLDIKSTLATIINQLNITSDNITKLYRDDCDYENSLNCHFSRNIHFNRISKSLKLYLIREVEKLHPDMEKKQLRKAYRQAGKGD